MRKLEMALPQCKSEVPDELPPTEQCSEERDGNATVKDRTIVQKKVINESDPTTQPQSSSAVATAGRQSAQIYSVGKVDVRGRKVAKASGKRALAEETECNVGTSGAKTNGVSRTATVRDELVRNKRKPKFVMHIIQGNIEQSRSKAEKASMENFDYGDDEPIDLSIKSRQGQVLDKQSDDAMSNGQHCDENCDEQSSGKMDSSENATPSSEETCNKHELTEASQRYRNRTLSSFTPEEQEEIRRKASRIDEGAKFDSFDEFEECLEAYKVAWNYPFRRASSEHLRDGEGRVITRFKYKYIVFHCAHYGLPRKRGDGKRPNQNYLPLGCEARFRLNSDTTNGYLRISSFHKEHKNHGSTEEDYLRVVNKKRRNVTEETTQRCGDGEERMACVREVTNAPENTENRAAHVVSPPRISPIQISSQGNSAFVPVIQSVDMDDGVRHISQSPTSSAVQQMFTTWLSHRLQRLEYLVINAYIINCGRYLPEELYIPFIYGIYGADYHLSEWSNVELRDVTVLLLQPPEILLQGSLPNDISINEIKRIRPLGIQRAVRAIREEKLKRFDQILMPLITRVFSSASSNELVAAVDEMKKLVDDVRIITDNIINSYDRNMLQY